MMVPQSYRHATALPPSRLSTDSSRDIIQSSRPKDIPKRRDGSDGRPKMLSSISASTPSKPVVIPTRTQTPKARRSRPDDSPSKPLISAPHDPNALPPSMAALLAVASVQNGSSFTLRRSLSGRNIRKESLCLDDFRYTASSSSPKSWSILQGPPDDGDEENKEREGDSWSITSGSTVAPLSSYRSLSSDSMPSLDMEMDMESPSSPGPPTPASRIRAHARREKRQFHKSSLSESDHPLSPPSQPEAPAPEPAEKENSESLPTTPSTPISGPRSPFKSNLTASIRLLKSAARSLSSMAPKPYVPDPIPRAAPLSKPLTAPEPLPRPISIRPSFANIDNLPVHLHLASPLPNLPPSTASIQLMPYVPSPIAGSALATAPPVFLPAANPVDDDVEKKMASPRPREPRENSDFLRVVCLEMNMRRLGKLNGEGRARIWLGPRADGEPKEEGEVLGGVIGAEEAVERRVLEEEGEVGVSTEEGAMRRSEFVARTSIAKSAISEAESRGRKVPSRWVGMTP